MRTRFSHILGAAGVSVFALLSANVDAKAAGVTLINHYDGGIDTWPGDGATDEGSYTYDGQTAEIYAGQIIGDPSVFTISSLNAQRVGPGGDELEIVINTDYAGQAGLDGTGYGALFITPGYNVWKPIGAAPYWLDQYQSGEWTYAALMPATPGAQYGQDYVYETSGGQVVLSNVGGDQITYPYNGNPGYYFRQGEAVQFTPGVGQAAAFTDSWSVDSSAQTITFLIADNRALGDDFAVSWAPTCANGIIEGQVNGIPEPSTFAMMLLGFAGLGFAGYRVRRGALA